MLTEPESEPGYLDTLMDAWSGFRSVIGVNNMDPGLPSSESTAPQPSVSDGVDGLCGIPLGPITADTAARVASLEEFATADERVGVGLALQGIAEGTSCVDISQMGEHPSRISENTYRAERRALGEDAPHRNHYWPNNKGCSCCWDVRLYGGFV